MALPCWNAILWPRPNSTHLVSLAFNSSFQLDPILEQELTLTADFLSNYNYGLAGQAIGVDLINNPDLVATDPVISFKTAIWFWMTPQANKPSSHEFYHWTMGAN